MKVFQGTFRLSGLWQEILTSPLETYDTLDNIKVLVHQ
jgi:hypothetical protein